MNKDHTIKVIEKDYIVKGIERAFSRLKQQATKPVGIKPEFNLEAYRLDIITRAIASIIYKKQKESNND